MPEEFPIGPTRRDCLKTVSAGFGWLALAGLCQQEAEAYESPLAPKRPHFPARAKRVIFLCMRGGPSQVESFDYKPKLNADNLKPGRNKNSKLFGSQWKFSQYGESGTWVSDLFPHLAGQVDKMCVINSMHTDNNNHPQALQQMHTGSFQFVRPSIGSWVLYGLGTENGNLPGFVSLNPLKALGGSRYYASAFLPAAYQASSIGEAGKNIKDARIGNLINPRLSRQGQRRQLDLLQSMNRTFTEQQSGDTRLEGMIESFELAFRMKDELPQVMDLSGESKSTLNAYGINGPSDSFGRQCLLARRFAEAGVRFIEITDTDWDHHGFVSRLMPSAARRVDQPAAALLNDLEQRGMLEDTLVVWGGEFGRTPEDPTQDGRGHNHKGYTMWLAGGGVKGGLTWGQTDEYGYEAVVDKVHLHDLHATILHSIGLDHERLTYRYAGRDFRLTDVHGHVVKGLFS
ncbi:MAG: DUF1501 domain-containing protein [Planctomycetes bacterium]|nr:DUF1501 domain-containing protein [Planctomycetota bacterium]MCH9724721.1 DUF1501 domain-containing protein [Planctomycetota bacterium]MCH9778833.1 DUF1501 domain-containing protein [Planctomycetota bacterium]MCH9790420.1 DUF1501 domain-containing protein [Planctomycetota bacterium]